MAIDGKTVRRSYDSADDKSAMQQGTVVDLTFSVAMNAAKLSK